MKSKEVWLEKRDENTFCFLHKFAQHGKRIKIIWEIEKHDGSKISKIHILGDKGVTHF